MKFKIGKSNASIPAGEYKAIITKIRPTQNFNRKTLEFTFVVAEGPHKDTEIRAFCNIEYQTFSDRTKLGRWYAVVSSESLIEGEELDTEVFYNKLLLVQVAVKVSKKTKNEFSNVTDILGVVAEL